MILALFTAATISAVDVQETAYGNIVGQSSVAVAQEAPVEPLLTTEEAVRSYFRDVPVLIEVARCESHFTHELTDGSILKGRVDQADTGVMQINKRYHEATATAMQIDLDDLQGNLEYARYLYDTQGTRPWNASMACWGNTLAVNY